MHDHALRALEEDVVHVWWFALDDPRLDHDALYSTLGEDEAARAGRMRKHEDRWRWIVARAALRQVLGRYVGIEPHVLRFSYGNDGRPGLANQVGDGALQFSLSHAGSYAVCALARGCRVGVDIELHGAFRHEDLARRRFTTQEVDLLESVPASERAAWFVQLWTYKEAYLKARGLGLDAALNGVVIVPMATGTAAILRARYELDPEHWTLRALPVMPGYCGAVAASPACAIQFRAWPMAAASEQVF